MIPCNYTLSRNHLDGLYAILPVHWAHHRGLTRSMKRLYAYNIADRCLLSNVECDPNTVDTCDTVDLQCLSSSALSHTASSAAITDLKPINEQQLPTRLGHWHLREAHHRHSIH